MPAKLFPLALAAALALAAPPRALASEARTPSPARAGAKPGARAGAAPDRQAPVRPEGRTAIAPEDRLLAGHLLRRLGFGPTEAETRTFVRLGPEAYLERQLHPERISDAGLESRLPPAPEDQPDETAWLMRWYARMVYSKRQLREKMTLFWHEHFATSNEKVGDGCFMHKQEELFRALGLGRFEDLAVAIVKDEAMLRWLDNDGNDGRATDEEGNPVPPNENFARELMQLFVLGTKELNLDGTPRLDGSGAPIPAYTEDDVKALSRALTGWEIVWEDPPTTPCGLHTEFRPWRHDPEDKVLLGETIRGREGDAGAEETAEAIAILLRRPTHAPFLAKALIQKLATETPTPGYVLRVATAYRDSGGVVREALRALFLDDEFWAASSMRSQYKTPVEQYAGALRALRATTNGWALIDWSRDSAHGLYYPPSVFSFYPPGGKRQLVNTALVLTRDRVADEMISWPWNTRIPVSRLRTSLGLTTPERAVDRLAELLYSAPIDPAARAVALDYMEGRADEEKLRGLLWLLMISPDFQRN